MAEYQLRNQYEREFSFMNLKKTVPVITMTAALLLTGCASQWVNNAQLMDVNGKPYYVGSQSTSGSCTEVTTSYLFDEKRELIESAIQSARGTTLLCAVMQAGAQSGPIGAGLARSGSRISNGSNSGSSSGGSTSTAGGATSTSTAGSSSNPSQTTVVGVDATATATGTGVQGTATGGGAVGVNLGGY